MTRRKYVRFFSGLFFVLGLLSAILAVVRLVESMSQPLPQLGQPAAIQEALALSVMGSMFFLATIAVRHAVPIRRSRSATYYKPKPNAEETAKSVAASGEVVTRPALVASKSA